RMVSEGAFREDLWYRLSVFPMRLPSLRERLEDLPQLAAHFAARAGERLGGVPLVPSADDLQLLLAYPWPGNVRELAAVIERAVFLAMGQRLDGRTALGASAPPAPAGPVQSPSAPPATSQALDAVVTAHIERVLAQTQGRIEGPQGAAAVLGVNPHTLRARMRKLGIDWARFRR